MKFLFLLIFSMRSFFIGISSVSAYTQSPYVSKIPSKSIIFSSPMRYEIIPKSSSQKNCIPSASVKRLPNTGITNIPNLMSIARMVAIPAFLGLRFSDQRVWSESLFAISSFSDYLDGFIARRYNMTSDFGAFIDPVADKLSVTVALISLLTKIPTWWFTIPVAAMISRELFVSGLREWMATRGLRSQVKVGWVGKWKTAFQMFALIFLLHSSYSLPSAALLNPFAFALHQQHIFAAGVVFLYFSTVLSLISAGQYLSAAWPVLKSS